MAAPDVGSPATAEPELRLLSRVAHRGQEVTSARLRGLLALLASDLRTGCSAARLVDGLWPDEQPEHPTRALRVLVSRARAQLGSETIAGTPTGYRLALRSDQVDASAVLVSMAASARNARAGDHAAALAHAEAGLALWDGQPDGDAESGDPVAALRAERASTYRSLLRARALALSRLGRHAEAVEALTGLVRERPRDEEVLLELLRCEAATVGPSAALGRYEAYRRSLRDELGSDPGPALRTLHQELLRGAAPAVRHGIAHEPNPLLGRDGDLAAVLGLLRTWRVTSIVGAGGLGKTRLAHAVGRRAEQRVVRLVSLAGVTRDGDVAGEVAAVLGAKESRRVPAGRPTGTGPADALAPGIAAALGPGPALLVLDNCEHVLRGAAELVGALVSLTPEVRVLTTSRAPLGLSSESVYPLPELDLTTSVELFTQRAGAARPGADLPTETVEAVCRHLDGLPLAVELAAARARVMSVAEIARGLDDRFGLLRGGPRDAPQRHHTLRAVVDWSWNLLEPGGQAAMRALSVFPGGFTADAARHLLGGDDVLEVLEHLVGQSLLKVTDTPPGTRLSMLETVREFATARREAAGETERATAGFLAWARDFGITHHESAFGADPFSALERIRAEQDNLAAALRRGLERADGATVAATTAVLGGLWVVEPTNNRILTLVDETAWILSHFRPEPGLVEVTRTAATQCAMYALLAGPHAARWLATVRRLPPAPPDTLIRAFAIVLGAVPTAAGPDRLALRALRDSDEPLLAGAASGFATFLGEGEGDLDGALEAAQQMLRAFDGPAMPWVRILAHSRIGDLCLQLGRVDDARQHLKAALRVQDESGERSDQIGIQWQLVLASLQLEDIDAAQHWLELATRDPAGDTSGTHTLELGIRAEILLARGKTEAGLRQWRRVAEQVRSTDTLGLPIDSPAVNPWILEVQAATVIAHAHHGRLQLVADITGELPGVLSVMLTDSAGRPPPSVMDFPACGAGLLALAMADLDRDTRGRDRSATRSGARMIALAQRFNFPRNFQPTMSAARARQAAERADRSAYNDAVSSYADLDREELRAAALAVLRERGRL